MVAKEHMSSAAAGLYSALDPDIQAKVSTFGKVSAAIEVDRHVRMWKISANKVSTACVILYFFDLRY